MFEHDELIVSALNTARYYPFDLCVFSVEQEEEIVDENGNKVTVPLFKAMQSDELMTIEKDCFYCDMTGTGAMMISAEILDKIKKPYFKDVFSIDGHRVLCDDFYFGYKLYKAGQRVLIDTRIIPGHLAKIMVKPYNALELRRAYEKVNSGFGYWKNGIDPKVTLK